MKAPIAKALNETQMRFNQLCEAGGGVHGGPARGKTLELIRESGLRLNELATREMKDHLAAFPDANPWYVCFAVGLSWGHLAQLDLGFTKAVVGVLTRWNSSDLDDAKAYQMERGSKPIEQSLIGAHMLFNKLLLPKTLPSNLVQLAAAQNRWFSPIVNPKERPPYIGAWNATAMFMTALFAQPGLAALHLEPPPLLPPGGPIHNGLKLLSNAGILSTPPAGNDLDDGDWEPGVIFENNALFAELCKQLPGWSLIDVHSGLYMLGTRHPHSGTWA
jgi:hypothetical protein